VFFVLNSLSTFIVIGIGVFVPDDGHARIWPDMAARLAGSHNTRPVLAALAFLTVGVSLKLALFPLHQWLPNAYTYAPSAVTAFLAATATKVSIYVLIRFYYGVFGESLVYQQLPLAQTMLGLSLLAMFAANFIAIFQHNLKRLFAYSSVGQIGYITLGLSFDSVTGLSASIVHLVNHGVTKAAIFLLIGGMALGLSGKSGGTTSPGFDRLNGLSQRMPLTSFGVVLAGLSLIGVPGTAGFVSKWTLILAALEKGQFWLVGAIVLSSLLAVAVRLAFCRGSLPAARAADRVHGRAAGHAVRVLAGDRLARAVDRQLAVSRSATCAATGAAPDPLLRLLRAGASPRRWAIAFAANLFTLFLFYEMLTLVTYPLVTHHGTDKARGGGRTYLAILMGTSIVFLLPAVITWHVAGTTDFRAGRHPAGRLGTGAMAGCWRCSCSASARRR
jgi:formate hydrogenlyase subunit 3/multisubunit Na+/H+ antiporter MnhD subunit